MVHFACLESACRPRLITLSCMACIVLMKLGTIMQECKAATSAGLIEVEIGLKQAPASYSFQHQVMGRALLPGTAMLDSSFAAASILLTGSKAWKSPAFCVSHSVSKKALI